MPTDDLAASLGAEACVSVGGGDTTDLIAVYNGTIGVSIVTATGVDGVAILDAVVSVSGTS